MPTQPHLRVVLQAKSHRAVKYQVYAESSHRLPVGPTSRTSGYQNLHPDQPAALGGPCQDLPSPSHNPTLPKPKQEEADGAGMSQNMFSCSTGEAITNWGLGALGAYGTLFSMGLAGARPNPPLVLGMWQGVPPEHLGVFRAGRADPTSRGDRAGGRGRVAAWRAGGGSPPEGNRLPFIPHRKALQIPPGTTASPAGRCSAQNGGVAEETRAPCYRSSAQEHRDR